MREICRLNHQPHQTEASSSLPRQVVASSSSSTLSKYSELSQKTSSIKSPCIRQAFLNFEIQFSLESPIYRKNRQLLDLEIFKKEERQKVSIRDMPRFLDKQIEKIEAIINNNF